MLSKREHFPLLGKAPEAFTGKVWPPKAIPWATRTLVDTSVKDKGRCKQQFLPSKREHFPLLGKALEAFKVWPPKAIPWATRTLVDTSVVD